MRKAIVTEGHLPSCAQTCGRDRRFEEPVANGACHHRERLLPRHGQRAGRPGRGDLPDARKRASRLPGRASAHPPRVPSQREGHQKDGASYSRPGRRERVA
jgi:hypothetical protein